MTSREVEVIARAVRALETCGHAESYELRSLLTESVEWLIEKAMLSDGASHGLTLRGAAWDGTAEAGTIALRLGRKVGKGHAKLSLTWERHAGDYFSILGQLGIPAVDAEQTGLGVAVWGNQGCYTVSRVHGHTAVSDARKHPLVGKTIRLRKNVDARGVPSWVSS